MDARAQGPGVPTQGKPRIVFGAEAGAGDTLRSRLLPWVLDAAQPYARCLYGDDRTAAAVFAATMRRRGSELSLERAAVLIDAHELCGMYFAVPGAELMRSRRQEFVDAMRLVGPGGFAALRCRMDALNGMFPPVADNEFYLSKLAVASGMRGRGLGQALLSHCLQLGCRFGFRQFRLDVSAGNLAAVRLYERHGYRVTGQSHTDFCNLKYLSMTLAL